MEYLIGAEEQTKRRKVMQKVCLACHSSGWVEGHYARFENTIKTTNQMTLTATKILLAAWEKGVAKGPAHKDSIFNEAIEKSGLSSGYFLQILPVLPRPWLGPTMVPLPMGAGI